MGQVHRHAGGGQHGANEAKLPYCPSQLLDGGGHVLHGNEGHGMDTRADAGKTVGHVIVVAAADPDGVFRQANVPHRKALAGEDNGVLDVALFQKGQDVLAGAGTVVAGSDASYTLPNAVSSLPG